MRTAKDMSGMQFGRLTVLSRAPNNGKQPAWHCQCVCGNTTVANGENLRRGATTSCGCKRRENFVLRCLKHSDKSRSKSGNKGQRRTLSLEEALAEVSRTWPERLQEYARGEA